MSSQKIKVILADDEAPARKRLKNLLSEYDQFQIVGEAENGDEVLKLIISENPDLAFLDINMPGASVFTTIPSLKNPPQVIFQTAYSEYGAKAFDINALDYLLKPISRERFEQSVNKIDPLRETQIKIERKEKSKGNLETISIKSGDSIRILKVNKINRISFEEGFSFIHLANEKIYSDRSLNFYEENLESSGFYRISRADMINILFINKLHPMFNGQYIVEMLNGDKINISRRRTQGLKDLLN